MFKNTNLLSKFWCFLLDCLFPIECLVCGREGEYICGDCAAVPVPAYPALCFGCHKPEELGRLCLDCSPRWAFDGVIIAADYEHERVRSLIRTCKYRFVTEVAVELAALTIPALKNFMENMPEDSEIAESFFNAKIIPVPLSKRRLHWRGFNQAALIGERIATYFALELNDGILQRRHRRAQATLGEAQRLENLSGSFRLEGVVPSLVILVDDVITTGTTLNECAKVLKTAGAQEVWCVAVAKG